MYRFGSWKRSGTRMGSVRALLFSMGIAFLCCAQPSARWGIAAGRSRQSAYSRGNRAVVVRRDSVLAASVRRGKLKVGIMEIRKTAETRILSFPPLTLAAKTQSGWPPKPSQADPQHVRLVSMDTHPKARVLGLTKSMVRRAMHRAGRAAHPGRAPSHVHGLTTRPRKQSIGGSAALSRRCAAHPARCTSRCGSPW